MLSKTRHCRLGILQFYIAHHLLILLKSYVDIDDSCCEWFFSFWLQNDHVLRKIFGNMILEIIQESLGVRIHFYSEQFWCWLFEGIWHLVLRYISTEVSINTVIQISEYCENLNRLRLIISLYSLCSLCVRCSLYLLICQMFQVQDFHFSNIKLTNIVQDIIISMELWKLQKTNSYHSYLPAASAFV